MNTICSFPYQLFKNVGKENISFWGLWVREIFEGEIVRLQDEFGKSDNFFAGSIGLKINKLLSEIKIFDFFQEIPRCGVRSKVSHFRAPF